MTKLVKQKPLERDDETWRWIAIEGDNRDELIRQMNDQFPSFEPLLKAAIFAALPAGLANDKITKKIYEKLRPGSMWLKDDFGRVATLISAHSSHIGIEPKILWKDDGPAVQWDAASDNPAPPPGTKAAVVLTDGWLYVVFGEAGFIFNPRTLPAEPGFIRGLVQGKLILPADSEGTAGFGIDCVANAHAAEFQKVWPKALAASHESFQASGSDRRAFAFLPNEDTFICDGPDCGVISSTSESFETRTATLTKVFNEVGVFVDVEQDGDVMSAWHQVVVKAAAEAEKAGAPLQVLAAHAQLALELDGQVAKALVKAARLNALLELPRDVKHRFVHPSGNRPPEDLPFPLEGFARLCPDCYASLTQA
jgi:hypothetical protein